MGWDVAIITSLVARLAYQQKNFPLAKDSFRESLMRLRIFGSPTFIAWCLEGCAEVLCEAGLFRTTTHLCAAATKMRKQAGTPLPVQERQALERVIQKASAGLGELAFTREWLFGAGLTQEEAIELALSELDLGAQAGSQPVTLR